MSNYTTNTTLTTDFEGDEITVVLKRLKRGHMMTMMGFMHKTEDGNMEVADDKLVDMMDFVGGWVDEYIVSFTGLRDANGDSVGFDVVKVEQYFFELYQNIVNHLMAADAVSKDTEKKLDEPSDDMEVPALLQVQAD